MVLAGIGDIREETVVATKLLVAILLTAVVDQRLWKGQLTIDPPSTRIASLSIPTDSSRCLVSWWAVRGCWTCCLDVLQPLLSCRSFLFWGEKDGGCLVLRCALQRSDGGLDLNQRKKKNSDVCRGLVVIFFTFEVLSARNGCTAQTISLI